MEKWISSQHSEETHVLFFFFSGYGACYVSENLKSLRILWYIETKNFLMEIIIEN